MNVFYSLAPLMSSCLVGHCRLRQSTCPCIASDVPGNKKEKAVSDTWIRGFENMIPELAELFKDQPVESAKRTFQYDHDAWEREPGQLFLQKTKAPPESSASQKS